MLQGIQHLLSCQQSAQALLSHNLHPQLIVQVHATLQKLDFTSGGGGGGVCAVRCAKRRLFWTHFPQWPRLQ